MNKTVIFTSLGFCLATLANAANPLPTTPSYLGIDYITVSGNEGSSVGSINGGGGGEFLGTATRVVGGLQVSGSTVNTNYWCVDDQENFTPDSSKGNADVVLLSQIASQASKVRYSNVTDTGTPVWTNTTVTSANDIPSAAMARYEMAAYLVQQYNGFNQTINNTGTCGAVTCQERNNDIQNAIWAITSNSTYSNAAETTPFSKLNAVALGWVNQAISNYATVNTSGWAVVSWTTASASDGSLTGGTPMQTFLVQIATPEPQFVFLSLIPLAGVFFSIRRRRAKTSV